MTKRKPSKPRPAVMPRRAPKPCATCYSPMTTTDGRSWTCPRHGVIVIEPEPTKKRR